jgi:hypothetical protein
MVTTRSMIKRQLEAGETAPLIPANERTRARAAKPKQPKGERVRKQRLLAIAPQEDQPVSARLRSAKQTSDIKAKKMGDVDVSQYARLDDRLKDNASALETECLPLCVFSNEKRKDMDEPKEVCVYIKLRITPFPAPTNEPKKCKSETFSNNSLESEANLLHDDPSSWIPESFTDIDYPDDYDDVPQLVDEDDYQYARLDNRLKDYESAKSKISWVCACG